MCAKSFYSRIAITFLALTTNTFSGIAQDSVIISNDKFYDAWIWSWSIAANVNFGKSNTQNQGFNNVIRAESWEWTVGKPDTIRALLNFDLSAVPSNATIVSAKLSLFHYSNPNFQQHTGQNAGEFRLITQPWKEEDVTWNNKPSVDGRVLKTTMATKISTEKFIDIEMTKLVQILSDSTNKYFGIEFRLSNEIGFNVLSFASSENTNVSVRPFLKIEYSIPNSIANEHLNQEELRSNYSVSNKELTIYNIHGKPQRLIILNDKGQVVYSEFLLENQNRVSVSLTRGIYFIRIQGKTVKMIVFN